MANDLEDKITKQIEYYFGDINLPRDKFLQEKIKEDEGWIGVDVLLTFKRLASLSTDPDVIIKAIKNSGSDIVEVSEDSKRLRRSPNKPAPELDDERKKELMRRTAYAKGFSADESLDDIMDFLKPYGPIESCIKRSYTDRATKKNVFKGSCFIIFKDEQTCEKFLDTKLVKYKDVELICKPQAVYIEEKKKEYEERKNQKKKGKGEGPEKVAEEQVKAAETKFSYPLGAIAYFSGIKEEDEISREEIKEKIAEITGEEPPFIYYSKGETVGYVKMPKENSAVEFYEKLTNGELEIGEIKLNFRVLEGDEEKEFLKKMSEDITKRRNQYRKGKRFGKKRFSNKDIKKEEPMTKKIKAE